MFIVIFGAGAVGASLALDFSRDGHDVVVIEQDPAICTSLASRFDGLIIQGDGTSIRTLADAQVQKADCFAAVTGSDKDNMIACGLAKKNYHVPRTIGRVNDPVHEKIFPMMGVDFPISATRIIARAIANESSLVKEMTLLTMKDGDLSLVRFQVSETSRVIGKPLRDLPMPDEARISIVERGNEVCIPNGNTVLQAHDLVFLIMRSQAEPAMRDLFLGGQPSARTPRKPARVQVAA